MVCDFYPKKNKIKHITQFLKIILQNYDFKSKYYILLSLNNCIPKLRNIYSTLSKTLPTQTWHSLFPYIFPYIAGQNNLVR